MPGDNIVSQIFVSFSTEDKHYVKSVVERLQTRFHGTLFYYPNYPTTLDGSQADTIKQKVLGSDAVICFVSQAAGRSPWVENELRVAKEHEPTIPIIGVRVPKPDDGESIPPAFFGYVSTRNLIEAVKEDGREEEIAHKIAHSLPRLLWRPEVDTESLLHDYVRCRKQHTLGGKDLTSVAQGMRGLAVVEENRHDGTPRCLYSELTGYYILDSLRLYDLRGDPVFLTEASEAATWLTSHAMANEYHGVLTRHYMKHDSEDRVRETSFSGGNIYSFDTAICLIALVTLTRRWGHLDAQDRRSCERRYDFTREACLLGTFLCRTMMQGLEITADRPIAAVFSTREGKPLCDDEERWSRRFGPHHARVAEALVLLYSLVRDPDGDQRASFAGCDLPKDYLDGAVRICDAILKRQDPEGEIETSKGRTELHPLAYGAEGLLTVGEVLKESRYIEAARLIVEWALDKQNKGDGSIPQVFKFISGSPLGPAKRNYRTDAVAQILLVAARLGLAETDPEYQSKVDQIVSFLQRLSKRKDCFPFGFLESESWRECRVENYWTWMYAVHGLIRYKLSRIAHQARVLILAGGGGTRLWPLSCRRFPKPFSSAMLGTRSLLEETLRRFTQPGLIPAENIFVLCAPETRRNALGLCAAQGVYPSHVLSDQCPQRGTIPATKAAIVGVTDSAERSWDQMFGSRVVIVSFVDDVFDPADAPCGIIERLLIAADSKANRSHRAGCFFLLGAPTDDHDSRLGHMELAAGDGNFSGALRCVPVRAFHVKPSKMPDEMRRLLDKKGRHAARDSWAWDCGLLVALGATWQAELDKRDGNLDQHLLAELEVSRLRVATLHHSVRFDDFGVPGVNLLRFFRGSKQEKQGNVIIGTGPDDRKEPAVRVLCASGNVIISDRRRIDVYGVNKHLIVDSSITNSALVVPLDKVSSFQAVYENALARDGDMGNYLTGGKVAHDARPVLKLYDTQGRRGAATGDLPSAFSGCAVLVDVSGIECRRTKDRLWLHNRSVMCPPLEECQFETLARKQAEDARLVQHLVHVYAIGHELCSRASGTRWRHRLKLSQPPARALVKDILIPTLLYHDYGGCLDPAREDQENETQGRIREVTKLDRRHLDTHVIEQFLKSAGKTMPIEIGPTGTQYPGYVFNDDVNSAASFIRDCRAEYEKGGKLHLLDIAVMLLQSHDSPQRFGSFLGMYHSFASAWIRGQKASPISNQVRMPTADEVMELFALVKISDMLSCANWQWKRLRWRETRKKPDLPLREPVGDTLKYLCRQLELAGFTAAAIRGWCEFTKEQLDENERLEEILNALRNDA